MQNVSDKPVKWIGEDGEWKVGNEVLDRSGDPVIDSVFILIRHKHCGSLEWVYCNDLTPYVVTPEFK